MTHLHNVHDSDSHFTIDPITREIKNDASKKKMIMQNDHKSERFSFSLPRFVEGHDMLACDRVEIHFINTDASSKDKKSTGIYEVDDIQISPEDKNNVVCSWLVWRSATKYAGLLSFIIRFVCLDEDNTESYAWHTAICSSITVSGGILNSAIEIVEPYADVLAQWKEDLFGVGDSQEQKLLNTAAEQQAAIAAEGEKQIAAVAGKGAAVLNSIPETYADVSALADNNYRNKADIIELDAEGKSIVLNDSSNYPLKNLKVFGRSEQLKTESGVPSPSPDFPQDIINIGDKGNISVFSVGKQLYDVSKHNGNFATVDDDGFYTLSYDNTASANVIFFTVNVPPSALIQPNKEYLAIFEIVENTNVLLEAVSNFATDVNTSQFETNVAIPKNTTGIFAKVIKSKGDFSESKTMLRTIVDVSAKEKASIKFRVSVYSDISITADTFGYEPFKDGGTVVLSSANGLPGIPVEADGNYTDENGQQWIGDEIDLKRGVYIQRLGIVELDASSDEYWYTITATGGTIFAHAIDNAKAEGSSEKLYCTHFAASINGTYNKSFDACYFYDKTFRICHMDINTLDDFKEWLRQNAIKVQYILAEPIETPLSDAEIAAFRALNSNKPITTIMNDSGAYMAVKYAADTKAYIDNKIVEMLKGSD